MEKTPIYWEDLQECSIAVVSWFSAAVTLFIIGSGIWFWVVFFFAPTPKKPYVDVTVKQVGCSIKSVTDYNTGKPIDFIKSMDYEDLIKNEAVK